MSEREKRVAGVMLNDTTYAGRGTLPLAAAVGENNAPINIVRYFLC